MPGPDHRLHGTRLVHDHQPGALARRLDEARHRQLAALPVAEHAGDAGQRLLRRHVPDYRHDGVVRQIVRPVERLKILAGDPPHRVRSAGARPPVRVLPVHQAAEYYAGDVARIVVADLHARQQLAAVAGDLGQVVGGPPGDVGQQVQGEIEAVLHHQDVDEAEVVAGADRQRAADVVDVRGDLLRGPAAGPPVEHLRRHRGNARQRVGIVGGSRPHEQAHVHHRLLARGDHDNLQAVVELQQLVFGEFHLGSEQRRRRALDGPAVGLLPRGGHCGQ